MILRELCLASGQKNGTPAKAQLPEEERREETGTLSAEPCTYLTAFITLLLTSIFNTVI